MNRQDPTATFQMKGYHMKKLLLDNPLADLSEDKVELQYFAHYRYSHNEEQWNGLIGLGFRVVQMANNENTNDNQPLFMESIIEGEFSMNSENTPENEETFSKRLRINGASTLIPIMRAAVCSTSSLMGYPGKYSIPNINVYSLSWTCDNSEIEAE